MKQKATRRKRAHYRDFIQSEVAPDFRQMLCQLRPALASLKRSEQAAFAWIVWCSRRKGRRHSHCPGAFFLTYQELEALFGEDKFMQLNDSVRIVEVVRDWLPEGAACEWAPREAARAFRLAPDVAAVVRGYFANIETAIVSLIHPSGRQCLTPPQAIAPKKRDGSPRVVWAELQLPNRTPVDLDSLASLRANLVNLERNGWSTGDIAAPLTQEQRDYIADLREETEAVILMCRTNAADVGFIAHRYVEADMGRLTAQGVNLQWCNGLIRRAALHGMWDHDVSNCHLAIVEQMARERGVECPEIVRYLTNKKSLRAQLAARHLLTTDEAKQCLIAVVYGAHVSPDPEYSLAEIIDPFRVSTLSADPDFCGIAADVARAREAILDRWPHIGKQRFRSMHGGSIPLIDPDTGKETTPAQRLACIVQGVEAAMLRAVVREYGSNMVLVQHDGWTSRRPMDCRKIRALIKRETEFDVEVEREEIEPIVPAKLSEILEKRLSYENRDFSSIFASRIGANTPVGYGWVPDRADPWSRFRPSPLLLPTSLVRS